MSDWIDELAIEAFNDHALAGLALGVVRDGRLDHFVGLGLADAEDSRPVDSRTVFRIGSISKTSDWRVPVAFERGGDDDAVAVRAGSARGGLLRLERRAKATSVRLWGRALVGAGAVGAVAAAARWRRR